MTYQDIVNKGRFKMDLQLLKQLEDERDSILKDEKKKSLFDFYYKDWELKINKRIDNLRCKLNKTDLLD